MTPSDYSSAGLSKRLSARDGVVRSDAKNNVSKKCVKKNVANTNRNLYPISPVKFGTNMNFTL